MFFFEFCELKNLFVRLIETPQDEWYPGFAQTKRNLQYTVMPLLASEALLHENKKIQ